MSRAGGGGVETAEKNWVMIGWDGLAIGRLRLREGGGWRSLRAARLGEEWDPGGLGCSIRPSARLSKYVPGELGSWGQGLRLGLRRRWCRDCIHEDDWAVGVMVVGSPGCNGLDHTGSRHTRVG